MADIAKTYAVTVKCAGGYSHKWSGTATCKEQAISVAKLGAAMRGLTPIGNPSVKES